MGQSRQHPLHGSKVGTPDTELHHFEKKSHLALYTRVMKGGSSVNLVHPISPTEHIDLRAGAQSGLLYVRY